MRNYKKYRSGVITLFSDFLTGKLNKIGLIYHLTVMQRFEPDFRGKVQQTEKQVWFRFFKNDTGAWGIQDLKKDIGCPTNDAFIRECMQIAVDNPKGLQIYYS